MIMVMRIMAIDQLLLKVVAILALHLVARSTEELVEVLVAITVVVEGEDMDNNKEDINNNSRLILKVLHLDSMVRDHRILGGMTRDLLLDNMDNHRVLPTRGIIRDHRVDGDKDLHRDSIHLSNRLTVDILVRAMMADTRY